MTKMSTIHIITTLISEFAKFENYDYLAFQSINKSM